MIDQKAIQITKPFTDNGGGYDWIWEGLDNNDLNVVSWNETQSWIKEITTHIYDHYTAQVESHNEENERQLEILSYRRWHLQTDWADALVALWERIKEA